MENNKEEHSNTLIYNRLSKIEDTGHNIERRLYDLSEKVGKLEIHIDYHIEGTIQNRNEIKQLKELATSFSNYVLEQKSNRNQIIAWRNLLAWSVGLIGTIIGAIAGVWALIRYI